MTQNTFNLELSDQMLRVELEVPEELGEGPIIAEVDNSGELDVSSIDSQLNGQLQVRCPFYPKDCAGKFDGAAVDGVFNAILLTCSTQNCPFFPDIATTS